MRAVAPWTGHTQLAIARHGGHPKRLTWWLVTRTQEQNDMRDESGQLDTFRNAKIDENHNKN